MSVRFGLRCLGEKANLQACTYLGLAQGRTHAVIWSHFNKSFPQAEPGTGQVCLAQMALLKFAFSRVKVLIFTWEKNIPFPSHLESGIFFVVHMCTLHMLGAHTFFGFGVSIHVVFEHQSFCRGRGGGLRTNEKGGRETFITAISP